ncbi:helix-turn-helix transcriptional regulator [Tessaracoccus sp. G1721]
MDNRSEVREFLMSRRARVEPEAAGLPRIGDRRVAGLRRSEAAMLAGVSVEYYARLERGAIAGASAAVLDGLARALQMDDAERDHLYRLARQAEGSAPASRRRGRPAKRWQPSPSLQWFLDSMSTAVALIGNGRTDLLAWNTLGRALLDEMITGSSSQPPNFARYLFLDPRSHVFYPDWEEVAFVNVAMLRTEAGRDPHDKQLQDLVGELSTRSEEFRGLWARHDVWQQDTGVKRFHHHVVGDLTLHYDGLDVVGQRAQLTVFTAEPGTRDAESLRLLGSWASSPAASTTVG